MAVIIPISIKQSNTDTTVDEKETVGSSSIKTPETQGKFEKAMKNVIVANMAKQTFQYAVSNVGKWTGNSRTQNQINNGIEAITLGVLAVTNPAMAVAQSALSIAKTLEEEVYRLKTENISLSVQRARNGYTDTNSIVSRRH